MKLPIGTRIRFTKTLDEPAGEEHPGRVYANCGDTGTIVGHDAKEGYMVKTDWWPNAFGAERKEFEPIKSKMRIPSRPGSALI